MTRNTPPSGKSSSSSSNARGDDAGSPPPLATGSTHRAGEDRRFPCPHCGAYRSFRPGQRALECAYCGAREEIPRTEAAIREHPLEPALLRLPQREGWDAERRAVRCESCGAVTTFAPAQTAGRCAFCGSPHVLARAGREHLVRPESLVPFRVTRDEAAARFREWLRRLWFRPNNLKHAASLGEITGAYLPFWTFDAFAASHWRAEAGYYYYETESYEEQDPSSGRWVTKTRQVQKIRWEPASGFREDFFDDELVCASRGLPEPLLRRICPYDLSGLVPYRPEYLAGFVAEEYQVDLREAWHAARERMQQAVNARCAGDVPGDTHRNLRVHTAYSEMTFKHLLLPVWIAAYLYGDRSYRFLVNGQTGTASGEAPLSWWKIAGFSLLVAAIAFLVWFFLQR